MKITAFILSILLSTTALAENRAEQYSDVSTMEIREQIEDAIEDGRISVMKMKADEAVEWVNEQFDRGDITEGQKNDLIRSIYSIEDARSDGPINGISELYRTLQSECTKCMEMNSGIDSDDPRSFMLGAMTFIVVIVGLFVASGLILIEGVVTYGLLTLAGSGAFALIATAIEKFSGFRGNGDACAQICSLANQAQQ